MAQTFRSTYMRAISALYVALVTIAGYCSRSEAANDYASEFDGACSELVRVANLKPYATLIERTQYTSDDAVKEIFNATRQTARAIKFIDAISYHRLDIDDSGQPDHVAISMTGTMRVTEAFIVLDQNTKVGLHLGGIDQAQGPDIGVDVGLIQLGGRHFLLSPRGTYLTLWAVRDERLVKACVLSEYSDGVRTLKSSNDALCETAKSRDLAYVDYPEAHALTSFPDENRFWMRSPGSGMRKIDIDNDGSLDNVARIEFSSGSGRGCDAKYVAVLDESRASVPGTSINSELERIEGHCGPNMELFIDKGETYLESSYEDSHSIGRFANGHYEQICQFVKVPRFERLR